MDCLELEALLGHLLGSICYQLEVKLDFPTIDTIQDTGTLGSSAMEILEMGSTAQSFNHQPSKLYILLSKYDENLS